jgi:hypothetical protein
VTDEAGIKAIGDPDPILKLPAAGVLASMNAFAFVVKIFEPTMITDGLVLEPPPLQPPSATTMATTPR